MRLPRKRNFISGFLVFPRVYLAAKFYFGPLFQLKCSNHENVISSKSKMHEHAQKHFCPTKFLENVRNQYLEPSKYFLQWRCVRKHAKIRSYRV